MTQCKTLYKTVAVSPTGVVVVAMRRGTASCRRVTVMPVEGRTRSGTLSNTPRSNPPTPMEPSSSRALHTPARHRLV